MKQGGGSAVDKYQLLNRPPFVLIPSIKMTKLVMSYKALVGFYFFLALNFTFMTDDHLE